LRHLHRGSHDVAADGLDEGHRGAVGHRADLLMPAKMWCSGRTSSSTSGRKAHNVPDAVEAGEEQVGVV
jgi:hypothetical protein